MPHDKAQLSFDLLADAVAALLRATGHVTALNTHLGDAANALTAAGDPRARDCERVVDLLRVVSMRLAGVVRSVGEKEAGS